MLGTLATSNLSEGALAEYITFDDFESFDVWKSKNSFPSNFHCIVGFKLINTSSVADEWRLKLPGNYTIIYLKKDDGTIEKFTSGTLVSYRDRPILSKIKKNVYFPLELNAGQMVTVLADIHQTPFYPLGDFQIAVYDPDLAELLDERVHNLFSDGVFNAILFILGLYALFYFLFTRRHFAIYLAIFCFCTIGYYQGFISGWFRMNLDPSFILYGMFVLVQIGLAVDLFFLIIYLKLRELMPFWHKLWVTLFYFLIAFSIIITIYYYHTQHFLSTLTIIIFVHLAYMVLRLSLGVRVLMIRTAFTNIMGLVLITSEAIKIAAQILMLVSLYDGYFLSRLGISIYALGIVISLSQRAAFANREKELAERARIREIAKLEEFKKLDTLKSRFFTNISHELRTPLTLVLGPINSVLKSRELSDRNQSLLNKAEQSGKNLLTMVSSILDLSKLESGKIEVHEEPKMLYRFMSRLVAAFESHAQRGGMEYTYQYDAHKDLQVQIDTEKVETIFNNLVSNAIKFTPPGGRISVKVEDRASAIHLSIKDTGRGIHADDIDHIFDRYYQSKQEDAPTEGGTGIGLALCQEYVNILGGKIWVESEWGEGAAFYVELPRKEVMGTRIVEMEEKVIDDAAEIGKVAKAGEAGKSGKPGRAGKATAPGTISGTNGQREITILVVEDNHSLREYLATILSAKYNVLMARNGKEAWEMLSGQYADSSLQDKASTGSKSFQSAQTALQTDCQLLYNHWRKYLIFCKLQFNLF